MAHSELVVIHEHLFSNSVRSCVVFLAGLENLPSLLVLQNLKKEVRRTVSHASPIWLNVTYSIS
jgi:hypothetical protein